MRRALLLFLLAGLVTPAVGQNVGNLIVRRIAYRGIKSINEADLLGAYKNNKINLSVETPFDPEKLTRAATVIKELLAAHGHPSATVKPSYEIDPSLNVVSILFTVDEGPKAKSSPNSH